MTLTNLTFNFPLHPGDVRAFRAAIVEQVGLGHYLFHGHDNSAGGAGRHANAYPLIRFGVHRGLAQIVGLGRGGQALVQHLLPVLPDQLLIAGRPCDTTNWQLSNHRWDPHLESEPQVFGLHHWLALNKRNYQDWKKLAGKPAARQLLLSRCLTGHLRALAETTAPELPRQQIVAQVLRQDQVKSVRWKDHRKVAFSIVAEANFRPPSGWGLGRCLSFGYGEVCDERTYYHLLQTRKVRTAKLLENS